jgi:hypothetical protein
MQQKLKNTLLLCAGFIMLSGVALGLTGGRAWAVPAHYEFACKDGTTAFTIAEDKALHAQVVTCSSGAQVVYIDYEQLNVQPVAVDVECTGNEQVSNKVDTPNQPTTKYVFTCVNVSGVGDHAVVTPASDTPTIKQGQATQVHCSDGAVAKNNDVQNCPVPVQKDKAANGSCSDLSKCDLFNVINDVINTLAAAIGVIVAISLGIGGQQYGSSGGDPSKVTAAKNRIRNSILALVAFMFLYTFLNFLIPGGLL